MLRTQHDGLQDSYSELGGLDCSEDRDMTDQRYVKESDVNTVLSRYGLPGEERTAVFGEVDYDIDLQRALIAIKDAKSAWRQMPQSLRTKYPDWMDLLRDIDSGAITIDNIGPPSDPPKPVIPPA